MSEETHHSMRRVAVGTLAEQANYWPYIEVRPPAALLFCFTARSVHRMGAAPKTVQLPLTGPYRVIWRQRWLAARR